MTTEDPRKRFNDFVDSQVKKFEQMVDEIDESVHQHHREYCDYKDDEDRTQFDHCAAEFRAIFLAIFYSKIDTGMMKHAKAGLN